jgi:peptidoglycan-N-acetylglucosamine deacetylase
MILIARSCPRRSFEIRRLPHWPAGRQFQFDPSDRLDKFTNGVGQALGVGGLLSQRRPQNVSCLVLHRSVSMSGTQPQFALQIIVEITDRDTCHEGFCNHCNHISYCWLARQVIDQPTAGKVRPPPISLRCTIFCFCGSRDDVSICISEHSPIDGLVPPARQRCRAANRLRFPAMAARIATSKRMSLPKPVLLAFLLAAQPVAAQTAQQPCPGNADALSTSRVIVIDPAATPRVGRKQFPATLPLADKEVVLTFDDGPWPGTTSAVLDALKRECVHATFFLVGRNAAAHPELARRELAEGHTVAHHSFRHPRLDRMKPEAAEAEIDRCFAAVDMALYGHATTRPQTPFFRFPGFASTPYLLDRLAARRIVVFGADLWAGDWRPMSPNHELHLLRDRLRAAHGGIILFHDTKRQTAAMLPAFLRFLKAEGYRVVHVVAPAV